MPWQQYVVDVALEYDPNTGLLFYEEVVLTVPRQSGKTTLLLSAMVQRAIGFGEKQRIIYTAQNRISARKKWEDEHVETLRKSKEFKKLFSVRKQLGQEAIRWNNGSTHGIESNTEKAGHGETLDMGVIDEAFAQEDDRLEQAFKPAMSTRPLAQLWVLSTAGNAKSTYLRSKVDAGRAHVREGLDCGVCYFEWSAPPEADPGDPATWWACMPALGHTISEKKIAGFYKSMKLPEFRRAFLNQWPDDSPDEWLVIPKPSWDNLFDEDSDARDLLVFSADVTPDRSMGSIVLAGKRSDGLIHVELTDNKRGTGWMLGRLIELNDRWKPACVAIDERGNAAFLIPGLIAAGVNVVKPYAREIASASAYVYDAVTDMKTIRHLDQPELNSALAGAVKRELSGGWSWARLSPSVDISPLVAMTNAVWGLELNPNAHKKKGSRPKVRFL
ncbi:terminase large subunit domain-containing protein [Nonomuraea wenchangensis]|uniref:Phage Terminase n=1 Tax=Nonomuraea wenchangensis TaxID=568860 RepID=A0A1I0ED33_9ACTN|nr:terminase family protein [Nonomuraea wenchangensis]SET43161.1 Phage Terminase [Nonomuraea wenchangensis]